MVMKLENDYHVQVILGWSVYTSPKKMDNHICQQTFFLKETFSDGKLDQTDIYTP